MASCIQTNVHRPSLFIPKVSQSRCQNDAPLCVLPLPRVNGSSMKSLKYPQNGLMQQQFATLLKHQKSEPVVKYRNGSAVCLLGGEDKSEKDNQGLAWNPLEKAMGSFKGQSIEDMLRQQIEKQEFYDGGSEKNTSFTKSNVIVFIASSSVCQWKDSQSFEDGHHECLL